jgi:hypothetical protein
LTLTTEEVLEHRHRCEVRQVLAWRTEDRSKAMDYLIKVKEARREKLERDCRTQWERGNRGKWGDWRGL